MQKKNLTKLFEIIAALLFISASLFVSQITGAVIGTSAGENEQIGGIIGAFALVFTGIFIWMKWKA